MSGQELSRLFDLTGRTALVTGASSGLGARFVAVLADAGATVYAAARRADRLLELAARIPNVQPVACDVAVEADRTRLVAQAMAETGRIDVLVNNAGISGAPLAEGENSEGFADVLDVNLVAPFHLSQLISEAAAPGHPISIINIASILGLISAAPMGGASYAASKAGLIGLTRELAGQWGRRSIRANAIAPGWFRSEMTADLFDNEKARDWVERNTMLRRAGNEEELDGALLFLAGDASTYCTGQTIVVDGGWTAR